MIENRNIATCIILSIVTCGIYGIYWLYCILTDLYAVTNRENKAGTDILLTIVTCGIYGYYMAYQMGKLLNEARYNVGLPPKDDSTMYLILSIFGFNIIVWGLVQSDLNDFVGPHFNNRANQYQQAAPVGGQYQDPNAWQTAPAQPVVSTQPVYQEYQTPFTPVSTPEQTVVEEAEAVIDTANTIFDTTSDITSEYESNTENNEQ